MNTFQNLSMAVLLCCVVNSSFAENTSSNHHYTLLQQLTEMGYRLPNSLSHEQMTRIMEHQTQRDMLMDLFNKCDDNTECAKITKAIFILDKRYRDMLKWGFLNKDICSEAIKTNDLEKYKICVGSEI